MQQQWTNQKCFMQSSKLELDNCPCGNAAYTLEVLNSIIMSTMLLRCYQNSNSDSNKEHQPVTSNLSQALVLR